jgi:N-methylhydantoinase B/oxoprolinase/acetone carboxylase alpha subunit
MAQLVLKNSKREGKYSGGKPVLTGYKASAHTKAHIHSNNNNNNNNRKNKCLCTNPEK